MKNQIPDEIWGSTKKTSNNYGLAPTSWANAFFANLFFLPMAQKMGNKTNITSMSAALLVEAAKLIAQKKHPLIVREKLNSYIPPNEWKRE